MISYEPVLHWGRQFWFQFATSLIILPVLSVWTSSFLARVFLVSWAELSCFMLGGSGASRNGASDFAYDTTWAWYSLRKWIVELKRELRYSTTINPRGQFCWPWESRWTKIEAWLWNGMMALVDISGRSLILIISRLGTSNPKQVGGGFRGSFCASTVGVPKIWFDDLFIGEVTRKNTNHFHPRWKDCWEWL